ncbi:MAG: hypothetical protein ACKOZN_11770 [Cyanobium sp.]|jgi:hypothetical protein
MATESVSFRITRNTEDLAQTTHALSQRVVKLEQRLQALELQLAQWSDQGNHQESEQLDSLENVERLLHDCRCLLGFEDQPAHPAAEVDEDHLLGGDQPLAA